MNAAPAPQAPLLLRRVTNLALAGLLILLPVLALRRVVVFALLNRPDSCSSFNAIVLEASYSAYNRGILSVNFFDHGFIRRGLGGTLLRLLERSPLTGCFDALIMFHALSALWLAVPLVLLARRIAQRNTLYGLWLAVILAVSPQLFWAWALDLGRSDMLTSGLVAWAVLAALRRRDALAIASILIGTTAHESAAIFGLPLLLCIWWRRDGAGQWRPVVLRAALLVAGCVVLFVLQALATTATPPDIVSAVLRSSAPSHLRDVAAYMTAHDTRTIIASWCQSLARPATPLYLLGVALLIAAYALLLAVRLRDLALYAGAVALPVAIISLVAIDYGRWMMFATLNAWLFAAAFAILFEPPLLTRRGAAIRLVGLLVLFAMRPASVYAPNLLTERVAARIWGQEGTELRDLGQCDPTWRTSLGLPARAVYPPPPATRESLLEDE